MWVWGWSEVAGVGVGVLQVIEIQFHFLHF